MKEAFRLLNKSIIRVEQPDIHLEEEEDEPTPMDLDGQCKLDALDFFLYIYARVASAASLPARTGPIRIGST